MTHAELERAFVATSYLLDRRGAGLTAPLATPSREASALLQALAHPERTARATVLARELARIAQALDARWLK
jgi:hypothetical protein